MKHLNLKTNKILCLFLALLLLLSACEIGNQQPTLPETSPAVSSIAATADVDPASQVEGATAPEETDTETEAIWDADNPVDIENAPTDAGADSMEDAGQAEATDNSVGVTSFSSDSFDLASLPAYDGSSPYTVVNGNIPYFSEEEKTTEVFETYSELDELGRCGVAYANICIDIMPTEERGEIGSVKPSGWQTIRYNDLIDGNYLYNRCHLIGYQLAGENANVCNLITGTRYLNVEGMLPFENDVADYVESTGNHVLYRVTPVFDGDNLVASGVLMEAWSVEDNGEGICFNVFCYNVQPGIGINYADGSSWVAEDAKDTAVETATEPAEDTAEESYEATETVVEDTGDAEETGDPDYVLNTNKKKIHYPWCSSVDQMADKNKEEYWGSIDDLLDMGYTACGSCKPE